MKDPLIVFIQITPGGWLKDWLEICPLPVKSDCSSLQLIACLFPELEIMHCLIDWSKHPRVKSNRTSWCYRTSPWLAHNISYFSMHNIFLFHCSTAFPWPLNQRQKISSEVRKWERRKENNPQEDEFIHTCLPSKNQFSPGKIFL